MALRKKAKVGIILGIIIFIIMIGGIFALLIFLKQKGLLTKPEVIDPSNEAPYYIKAIDEVTRENIPVNYRIEYQEEGIRKIFAEGKLSAVTSEVKAPLEKNFKLVTWSDEYYLLKGYDSISKSLENETILTDPELEKIGNLTITHSGQITGKKDIITLNLSTKDNFKKPHICFAWTSGFLDVSLRNNLIECEAGSWKNKTYNKETREYEDIGNNTYLCGEDYFEKCKYVRGRTCKPEVKERVPIRYVGLIDSCVYYGNNIKNETKQIELEILSNEYKNQLDEIKIYVFDMDRRWDETEQRYLWFYELNKENIGNPLDFEYVLNYTG